MAKSRVNAVSGESKLTDAARVESRENAVISRSKDKFTFTVYGEKNAWCVDYCIDGNYQHMSTIRHSPALGILELLEKIERPNGDVPVPDGAHIYTFECEPMGAVIFTTLAIDGKVEYSTVDESAAYGRWELAQALLETEVRDGI